MTIVVDGGNQSGKTFWLLHMISAYLMGRRFWLPRTDPDYLVRMGDGSPMPVPNSGRLVVPTFETSLLQNIKPKWDEIWPDSSLVWWENNARGEPVHCMTAWGSDFWVLSHKQDKTAGESATFHWAAFDEPPPRHLRIGMIRGLMQSAGPEIFACTMLFNPWMQRDIMSKAGNGRIAVFHFKTKANLDTAGGALKTAGVERFDDALTSDERRVRLEGASLGGGRCVPDFHDREPWVCDNFDIPAEWFRLAAVDPHELKPDAVQYWAFNPNGLEAVIYDEVMDETTQGSREQTVATMRVRESRTGGPAIRCIMDPRFGKKTTQRAPGGKGVTVADEFRKAGRPVEMAPGLDKVTGFRRASAWFRSINPITGKPRLRVLKRCSKTIESLSLLSWEMGATIFDTTENTVGPDDFASLVRYVVLYHPTVQTAIEDHGFSQPSANALEDDGVFANAGPQDSGDGSWVGAMNAS